MGKSWNFEVLLVLNNRVKIDMNRSSGFLVSFFGGFISGWKCDKGGASSGVDFLSLVQIRPDGTKFYTQRKMSLSQSAPPLRNIQPPSFLSDLNLSRCENALLSRFRS